VDSSTLCFNIQNGKGGNCDVCNFKVADVAPVVIVRPRLNPISQRPERSVYRQYVGVSEKSRFVNGDEISMQTWRWIELLQMLEVTTIGSRSQAVERLMQFATALLMSSCGSSCQMVCGAAFIYFYLFNTPCVYNKTTICSS